MWLVYAMSVVLKDKKTKKKKKMPVVSQDNEEWRDSSWSFGLI